MKSVNVVLSRSLVGLLICLLPIQALAEAKEEYTIEDVNSWMKSLSNWGRWGKKDELGTLNLITPEKRVAAAKLVKEGIAVSLAHPAIQEKAADNPYPYEVTMVAPANDTPELRGWAGDSINVFFHGYGHSHLDSLCHIFDGEKIYNGYSTSTVGKDGCKKLDIAQMKNGIFTRAVLFDIPRLRKKKWLEPNESVSIADLEAWEKKAKVKIGSGDVLLLRTGRWARRSAVGPWDVSKEVAGLHVTTVEWLRKRDIAVLGSDTGSDQYPSIVKDHPHALHQIVIVAMGTPIFDNLDLEEVAEAATKENRWEFLFTTAPLRIEGGTGSPINPTAVF